MTSARGANIGDYATRARVGHLSSAYVSIPMNLAEQFRLFKVELLYIELRQREIYAKGEGEGDSEASSDDVDGTGRPRRRRERADRGVRSF